MLSTKDGIITILLLLLISPYPDDSNSYIRVIFTDHKGKIFVTTSPHGPWGHSYPGPLDNISFNIVFQTACSPGATSR